MNPSFESVNIRVSVSHQINFEKALTLSGLASGATRIGVVISSGFQALVGMFATDNEVITPVGWLFNSLGEGHSSLNVYVAKQDDKGMLLPSRLSTMDQHVVRNNRVKSVIFLSERFNIVREAL